MAVRAMFSTMFDRPDGKRPTRENDPRMLSEKVALRQEVIAAMGGPAACRVFDAFAGAGEMYRRAWKECAEYTGCDIEPHKDERRMFMADNRRVMRAIDLRAFNLFDLDAFGSPWEQVIILAERRPLVPGERVAVVWTDGMRGALQMGAANSVALIQLCGIADGTAGLAHAYSEVEQMAIAGWMARWRAEPIRRWIAEGNRGHMTRYGAIIATAAGSTGAEPEQAAPLFEQPGEEGAAESTGGAEAADPTKALP